MNLSVVIPTYNRLDALRACLESIAGQKVPDDAAVEVLVVNDGGDPAAGENLSQVAAAAGGPFEWRYRHLDHVGPAALRNLAAQETRGEILLYLNDDVTLSSGHLAAHLRFHEQSGGSLRAARGVTVWASDSISTPLMRWLARQSFYYYLVTDLADIGYEFYHTSDISLPRRLVVERVPFDEAFPYPGFEDTEWGWRLEAAGVRLALLPAAVTAHHHVYDEPALARRSYANGVCAALLFDRVPELRHRAIDDFIRPGEIPGGRTEGRRRQVFRSALRALGALPGGRSEWAARIASAKARRRWVAKPLPEPHGPARWLELARREHVRGFLEHYQRLRGVPYPL